MFWAIDIFPKAVSETIDGFAKSGTNLLIMLRRVQKDLDPQRQNLYPIGIATGGRATFDL
jgi:hypothetical protein